MAPELKNYKHLKNDMYYPLSALPVCSFIPVPSFLFLPMFLLSPEVIFFSILILETLKEILLPSVLMYP